MIEDLQAMGLSAKEARTYLALVQYGTRATSFIAQRAGLNRGTTYMALHQLLEKGFATKLVKQNVQYFTAIPPERITNLLERKKEVIQEQIDRSGDLIDQLNQLASPLLSKPKVQFFGGKEGARMAMLETLDSKEEILRSFLSIHDVGDFLGAEFFEDYTNRRIDGGPFLHALRNRSKDEKAFATNPYSLKYLTSASDRREVRYLGKPIEFPMSIYLYDDRVLGLSSKRRGLCGYPAEQRLFFDVEVSLRTHVAKLGSDLGLG